MSNISEAMSVINTAYQRLSSDAIWSIHDTIIDNPYINTRGLISRLARDVDLFAIRADLCSDDDLATLISNTDPRVIALAVDRITVLIGFLSQLKEENINDFPELSSTHPIRSALIDGWSVYLQIIHP